MSDSLQLDAATQNELQKFVAQETAQRKVNESIHQFTGLCWDKCITNVTSGRLAPTEASCLTNCVGRFLDASLQLVRDVENKRNQIGHA
ncbi:hypothetical protein D9611_003359 [Ephemerocybe angulata]|uniref:Uncharacterized protein n=2 Tax=Ephemerocybe angulata TaxID=980116 RepID=A0A8H5C9E6_9AGAR|nr:hypothetical protein D9611_003359 [Tulosesus angulatus]KAF6766391.1 Tim10/DDP family zinc finger-domain-containing protein [Tulosesus angulatus]